MSNVKHCIRICHGTCTQSDSHKCLLWENISGRDMIDFKLIHVAGFEVDINKPRSRRIDGITEYEDSRVNSVAHKIYEGLITI